MGSTVFNKARVWSKKTASGEVVYLWEENTHCIKDGPKNAEWCFMKFGRKANIIERIYHCAENIPGGMLKVGRTSPERFIENMLKLLDNPLEITADTTYLENSKDATFYAAINDRNRSAVVQKFIEMGRHDLASQIDKSPEMGGVAELVLNLEHDWELILELANNISYKDGTWGTAYGITPWRLFRHAVGRGETSGPTEESPTILVTRTPEIRIYKAPIDLRYKGSTQAEYPLICTVDGKVVNISLGDYRAAVAVIREACNIHLKTGVCIIRKMMVALKDALGSVIELAPDGQIRLELVNRSITYKASEFDAVAAFFGQEGRDSMVLTFDEFSRFAAEKCYSARTLLEDSETLKVTFNLDETIQDSLI